MGLSWKALGPGKNVKGKKAAAARAPVKTANASKPSKAAADTAGPKPAEESAEPAACPAELEVASTSPTKKSALAVAMLTSSARKPAESGKAVALSASTKKSVEPASAAAPPTPAPEPMKEAAKSTKPVPPAEKIVIPLGYEPTPYPAEKTYTETEVVLYARIASLEQEPRSATTNGAREAKSACMGNLLVKDGAAEMPEFASGQPAPSKPKPASTSATTQAKPTAAVTSTSAKALADVRDTASGSYAIEHHEALAAQSAASAHLAAELGGYGIAGSSGPPAKAATKLLDTPGAPPKPASTNPSNAAGASAPKTSTKAPATIASSTSAPRAVAASTPATSSSETRQGGPVNSNTVPGGPLTPFNSKKLEKDTDGDDGDEVGLLSYAFAIMPASNFNKEDSPASSHLNL
ncbi:hypothetical protein HK101_010675 [Irineochytrium annulatum]|nr:hypothetical protein HK101_010675 [Irineochytrium annulatum]